MWEQGTNADAHVISPHRHGEKRQGLLHTMLGILVSVFMEIRKFLGEAAQES